MKFLLLIPILLFTSCTQVWVSPLGNDSAPGTSEAFPKRSLQAACTVPKDSDGRFILMEEGAYPEQGIPPVCDRTLIVADGTATIRSTSPSLTTAALQVEANDIHVQGVDVDGNALKRKGVHVNGNRVRLRDMDIGNINDDKAIEVWGDDVRVEQSNIHDARITMDGTHTECIFVVGGQRPHIVGNTFTGCGVYDVAFTRCVWCSPVGPASVGGVIEDNTFNFSLQLGGGPHYTELAFYSFMGEVRDFKVRRNHFETQADDPATIQVNEERGGVLLEPPWVGADAVRCGNTEGPAQNVIGDEWKTTC